MNLQDITNNDRISHLENLLQQKEIEKRTEIIDLKEALVEEKRRYLKLLDENIVLRFRLEKNSVFK